MSHSHAHTARPRAAWRAPTPRTRWPWRLTRRRDRSARRSASRRQCLGDTASRVTKGISLPLHTDACLPSGPVVAGPKIRRPVALAFHLWSGHQADGNCPRGKPQALEPLRAGPGPEPWAVLPGTLSPSGPCALGSAPALRLHCGTACRGTRPTATRWIHRQPLPRRLQRRRVASSSPRSPRPRQ